MIYIALALLLLVILITAAVLVQASRRSSDMSEERGEREGQENE